jgi:cytochrome c553
MTMNPLRPGAAGAALLMAWACGALAQSTGTGAIVTPAAVTGEVHVCSSCHGPEGRSVSPTFPRLAGQRAGYIEAQLKAFRDHQDADPHAKTYMWGMAAHLSDAMIKGLATYYAAQTPVSGKPGNPADMAAGKKIYDDGIPAQQVPACQACHGAHGEGSGAMPRLAGQHPEYIEKQLQFFASDQRASPIMDPNAKNLTADEIREVATYIGSQ